MAISAIRTHYLHQPFPLKRTSKYTVALQKFPKPLKPLERFYGNRFRLPPPVHTADHWNNLG